MALKRCWACARLVWLGPRLGVTDITVGLETLLYLNDNPGLVPGWGPVLADVVRQLALDEDTRTRWRFNLTDHHGQLLTQIDTNRRPTASERAFVKTRDQTCRAPGCRRRAIRCDDDHRLPASQGGKATRANLCCLCRHHHRLRHERGLQHHALGNDGVLWATKDGRIYLVANDGYTYLLGNDLDNAPPPQAVNQIIPHQPGPTLHRVA